jgi:ubiquinone biosynthesis accessory factor UbiJ
VLLDSVAISALNHVLASESWARERLRPFAGSQALLHTGVVDFYLAIETQGLFAKGAAANPVDVTISLPANAAVNLLTDSKRFFQAVQLSGSADFAETLAFVFRNIRWDAEADLAHFIGDIPAHRVERMRKRLFSEMQDGGTRLVRNLAEYATEDSDWLVPPRDIESFCRDVDILRDDLARLEKRLSRL